MRNLPMLFLLFFACCGKQIASSSDVTQSVSYDPRQVTAAFWWAMNYSEQIHTRIVSVAPDSGAYQFAWYPKIIVTDTNQVKDQVHRYALAAKESTGIICQKWYVYSAPDKCILTIGPFYIF